MTFSPGVTAAFSSLRRSCRRVGRAALPLGLCLLMSCAGPDREKPHDASTSSPRAAPAWPTVDQLPVGGNVLLVISDTHRRDHAAPLAAGWNLTPHLELLARRGVRFTDASTPIPISAPAYASLFTGLTPLQHGLLNNHQDLRDDLPVLAERLQELGYDTAAVLGNPFCSSHHGFGRGFDYVWDDVETHGKDGALLTDRALQWLTSRSTDRPFFLVVAYMDAHTPYVTPESTHSLLLDIDGQPWGTWVAEDGHREHQFDVELPPGTQHWRLTYLDADGRAAPKHTEQAGQGHGTSPLFMQGLTVDDPRVQLTTEGLLAVDGQPRYRQLDATVTLKLHNPTAATIHSRLRFRVYRRYGPEDTPQLYAAGVRHVDRQVGRLMAHLHGQSVAESTHVVFVSDHGEMLGEHGAWGHVEHLWQESLGIPLIVRGPGLPAGVEYSEAFDLLDVHRLVRVLAGDRREAADPTFPFVAPSAQRQRQAATFPPEASNLQVSVRQGPLQLILNDLNEAALFDLDADPHEQHDVLPERRDARARQLLALAQETMETAVQAEQLDLGTLSPEAIDRLTALGYLD